MSWQWIFDNAAEISIDKQPTVARSITRNNRVSAVVRSGYTYRFAVRMPAGLPYEENRKNIEAYEDLGTYTVDPVNIPQSFIAGYTGDATNITGWTTSGVTGRTIQGITPSVTPVNGDKILGAGDFVQIGTGNTYSVVEDVVWPANTATVNRHILETGTSFLTLGNSVTWDVICVGMPQWNIFDRDLVTWPEPFVFYEVVR